MLYLVVGIIMGFILALVLMAYALAHKAYVGKLKYVSDEDGTYFFMELTESLQKIIGKKYVLLEVDDQTQK